MKEAIAAKFKKLDGNNDGKVCMTEFTTPPKRGKKAKAGDKKKAKAKPAAKKDKAN